MKKYLAKLGEQLVKRFSHKRVYDPNRDAIYDTDKYSLYERSEFELIRRGTLLEDVFEERLKLVSRPLEFKDLAEGRRELVRTKCWEYFNSWVFNWIIDTLTYEQSMSTIKSAVNMEQLNAGRYTNYGTLGVKKLVQYYASEPKEKKVKDPHKLIDNI